MNARMNAAMVEATRLTRAGQLREAAALIQRSLAGGPETPWAAAPTPADAIDGEFQVVDREPAAAGPEPQANAGPGPSPGPRAGFPGGKAWPGIDLAALKNSCRGFPGAGEMPGARAADPLPEGARFMTGAYGTAAGSRNYKLYIPSGRQGESLPLVVMLHGCTQDPDDFAAGTRMNELAEREKCLVLYPAQAQSANGSKCWNWFKAGDQQRDKGEPAIIAGMTREVAAAHGADPRRIYVAGLSAGGAMAATMALIYPDLYAAVGIHSGLPHGVARDLPSALAAMQKGGAPGPRAGRPPFPVIVFHGDRDTTVHPCNGDQVISQCAHAPPGPPSAGAAPRATVERGQVPHGRGYVRTIHHGPDGRPIAEHWLIQGAGHAWSGGSSRGSYTDPQGPDASGQMLRFFREHHG